MNKQINKLALSSKRYYSFIESIVKKLKHISIMQMSGIQYIVLIF